MIKKLLFATLAFALVQSAVAMKRDREDTTTNNTDDVVKNALNTALIDLISRSENDEERQFNQIRQLLDDGASPDAEGDIDVSMRRGSFITHIYALGDSIFFKKCGNRVAKLLIERGATVRVYHLISTAVIGDVELCSLIVNKNVDVNATGKLHGIGPNQPALFYATDYGHAAVTKFLIAQGANVNAQLENGITALHRAAQGACAKEETKINAPDIIDYSSDEHEEICKYLLACGVDKAARDVSGKTAYDYYPKFEFLKP